MFDMTEWLTAFDEMKYFMEIFYDKDTTNDLTDGKGTTKIDDYYGFADPVKPIFKSYNITRFQPEATTQLPSLQIVIEDQRRMEAGSEIFGVDNETELSIYILALKKETLPYNGVTYYIEDANNPHPHENDLIMLLRAFVFQRLEDFKGYTGDDISWTVYDWTGSEYGVGIGAVEDMVYLRLTFNVTFQKE